MNADKKGVKPCPVGKLLGRSARKRQDIVNAAVRLFSERAYGDVSMDAVAAEAGVSKRTVYSHFASKEALFAEVMTEYCTTVREQAQTALKECSCLSDSLRGYAHTLLTFLYDPLQIAVLRVFICQAEQFPDLGRQFFEAGPGETLRQFAAELRKWAENGTLKIKDPERAASAFFGSLVSVRYMGCLLNCQCLPDEKERERMADQAIEIFLHGCQAEC